MSSYLCRDSIGRRDFLRACTVTGAGLASGLHRQLAKAAGSCPAGDKPPVGDIDAGLEIGMSNVCVAVGERLADGTMKLLGIGQAPSRGVCCSGINDCGQARESVRQALTEAEIQSDVLIRSVVLGVAGTRVSPQDKLRWQQSFELDEICYADGGDGQLRAFADGKSARDMHVLFLAGPWIQNSIRCLNDLGVEVERFVFAPVATAEALLSAREKNLGALLIDVGESRTSYAVHVGGALVQSDSSPYGVENIDADFLRVICRCIETPAAECGSETLGTIFDNDVLRALLYLVKLQVKSSGVRLDSLRGGIHLTGGCSLLPGICEWAEEVFGIPARRARLKGISTVANAVENPRFSCALGLVKFAAVGNNRNHDDRQH